MRGSILAMRPASTGSNCGAPCRDSRSPERANGNLTKCREHVRVQVITRIANIGRAAIFERLNLIIDSHLDVYFPQACALPRRFRQ